MRRKKVVVKGFQQRRRILLDKLWDVFMVYEPEQCTPYGCEPAGWHLKRIWCLVIIGVVMAVYVLLFACIKS